MLKPLPFLPNPFPDCPIVNQAHLRLMATLAYIRRAVGKADAPLHSYFALMTDDA